MMGHVHPVPVIGFFLPVVWFAAALKKRPERTTLDGGRYGCTCEFKQRRRKVNILNECVKPLTGLDSFWIADHEWHALGLFEHPPFVLIVVLAEHEALISCVDDNRVF